MPCLAEKSDNQEWFSSFRLSRRATLMRFPHLAVRPRAAERRLSRAPICLPSSVFWGQAQLRVLGKGMLTKRGNARVVQNLDFTPSELLYSTQTKKLHLYGTFVVLLNRLPTETPYLKYAERFVSII